MAATMEAAMFIMFNMHACVCACACVCLHACACVWGARVWGVPPPNPTPTQLPTRGYPQISKNEIRLERIEIFRFCLKI